MNSLVDQINSLPEKYVLTPTTLEKIAAAEQALDLSFAADYKACLLAFGAFSFDAHEITGICESERLNVVMVTNHYREASPALPRDLYVIEDLAIDNVIVVQKKDGTVYTYGPDNKLVKTASSLQDYLFPLAVENPLQNPEKSKNGFLKSFFKKLLGK